jgi:topoisomerase-4 subunit B
MNTPEVYDDASVRSLDWKEHIRLRPGMYIGKLGDGSSPDDGIYVLIKEILDNSIDEFVMGFGKTIEVTIKDQQVCIARLWPRACPWARSLNAFPRSIPGQSTIRTSLKKRLD